MATTFQNERLPNSSQLIGFSWLLNHFNLTVPLREFACVSEKRLASQRVQKGMWRQFDAQFQIDNRPYTHLEFSIKHEYIDLLVLKYILKSFPKDELIDSIKSNPKRILNKKIWFYYEFLLDERLPLDDLPVGKYDTLLDEKRYFVRNSPIKSQRHKINNNLLGTSKISPVITRTEALESYIHSDLAMDISNVIGKVSQSLVQRASSFLLLSDSQASFEIEGERATKNRIENWGRVINEAGKIPLSLYEIERLHSILLEDSRFIKIGLREDEVFLGDRDNFPIPEFIGARREDLRELIEDWIELDALLREDGVDPILHAVIIAFAFVST